ncbi:MAG: carboxylating nicotinate-nucleotide diphosphorylase [Bdellovibrio sp.]
MTLLELIRAAIKEDMPNGDVTTESLALKPRPGRARLKAKEDIVLSGAMAFEQSMQSLEPSARVKWHFEEGEEILKGQIICTIEGDLVQILKAERVALNFLGHLSGIATHTRRFVKAVAGTQTRILDTRKTTPAFREIEKRAVMHGGGVNHRMNLSTAILIKDNHISVMGGIKNAVTRVREHSALSIEVEARNLEEVQEAVSLNVQRILLDNMDNETLKKAVALIPAGIETEASGNMNLERVRSVAELGVHFISVGALTHSAPCADVSLVFQWED